MEQKNLDYNTRVYQKMLEISQNPWLTKEMALKINIIELLEKSRALKEKPAYHHKSNSEYTQL